MNNSSAILRWLITYAVIVPLALFIGYLLTNPLDYSFGPSTGLWRKVNDTRALSSSSGLVGARDGLVIDPCANE
jgi:hypothetical protein